MRSKANFTLTGKMVRDLCSDTPRSRLLHRLHAVVLVVNGFSSNAVSKMFGDSPRAVAYWVERFNEHGLAGLEELSRPGRPRKLKPNQLKRLQKFVQTRDTQAAPLKAQAVTDYVRKQFKVTLTESQCWRILQRLREQNRAQH